MNKLTKTLLILPVIALTTVGCGETNPRIETTTFGGEEITVNCTDKTVFDVEQQKWITRSEGVAQASPAAREFAGIMFDGVYGGACFN